MSLDSFFYSMAYRFGKPRWDTDQPRPELAALVAGRKPGRALDLGCGTGANDVYLASLGWETVGVDFAQQAIAAAMKRTKRASASATFVEGDVTRLRDIGVQGPFDLVFDIGCYHAIPAERRNAYADGVAAVTGPGADLYIAGLSQPPVTWRLIGAQGIRPGELSERFGSDFDVVEEKPVGPLGRASRFVLYHMVRKQAAAIVAGGV